MHSQNGIRIACVKYYVGPLDIEQPDLLRQLKDWLKQALKQFPDVGEGVIELAGVQHFITWDRDGDVVEVRMMGREAAEKKLNAHGLSTIEPWSPWPTSKDDHA